MSILQAVRGTRDLLPPETELWNHIETTARRVFERYAFGEIRTPIFEDTQLFSRGVGEETDIVSKEMYTFTPDAESAQSLTLRPENTAGVVRAYIEHNLGETGRLQKLYYIGPQFRRERPQRGRYRQFFQIGAEVIGPPSAGSESPLRDAEVLEMLATLLGDLGITGWKLLLNSVGSATDRPRFVQALRTALEPVVDRMCEDCRRRAVTNPLRVLDCKHPEDQPIIATLPRIWDSLDEGSKEHFAAVCTALDACGVPYEHDHRLVRGLDYYTRTTFEFVSNDLGAQNALLGGGRYDGLSEAIGGPRAPGIGFAIGEDRLVLALETLAQPRLAATYIAPLGERMNPAALVLARELRATGLRVELGDGSFRLKKSFEAGNKLARAIVIVGEDEVASGILTVKHFASGEQFKVARDQLGQKLAALPGSPTPSNFKLGQAALLDFLGTLQRTHTCGQLRAQDAGEQVILMGWVNRRRDHGNLIFLDLRDRTGITQIVLDKDLTPEGHAKAEQVRPEYVVAVVGTVRRRGPAVVNPKMATGEVEVATQQLLVLNDSRVPPFSPAEEAIANEELRLKYRYIDLRRQQMQQNFELRHKITRAVRESLSSQGFLEIETPFMTRSTPEGARDYLVPSRVHDGRFYALPQSPQLFKQILMISGFDRYFQIVRCFRDEDLRADRQPEFTQIDLEMSFVRQEEVFLVVENFLREAFAAVGVVLSTPFPRITYDDAMRRYGIDKPDLRMPGLTDVRSAFREEDLRALAIDPDQPVVVVCIPRVGELSRKERDDNRPFFDASKGAKLIDDWKRLEKSFPDAVRKIRELAPPRGEGQAEDLLLLVAGDAASHVQASDTKTQGHLSEREIAVYSAAGNLRVELARRYADRHGVSALTDQVVNSAERYLGEQVAGDTAFRPIWVTDFPMFEFDKESQRWLPAHHPFTSPHEEDMERLVSDPASVRARYYDLAMNGLELGSGSIRIHRQDVQQEIFRALGMSEEEARSRFGFFLEALTYGTPPHGGIALGLDRIAMILAGAQSLREVIAFPKTAKAIDLMVDAPTPVSPQQLRELHIRTTG